MKSVYVDGCSYVAGYGLEKQYSLASLLSKHYEVYDASRVGKCNYAIALDVYNQNKSYDYYVIGWTYSTRFEFNLDGNIVDASLSRDNIHLGAIKNGEYLEKEYALLQGKFFKYFSRLSTFNDYLIDSLYCMLPNKKIFMSWETRHCKTSLIYPKFSKQYRQQDTADWQHVGHLNIDGMIELSKIVEAKINE